MPTVAESIARTLKAYGTEKFFCLCGGDHELWYALDDVGIEIVNCRSEDAAVYMADGYARMTGKPGFVYGQRGPGVANVAGSLADALWAKSPVISLTSSIALTSRDRFEYQELDGLPLHQGVTKWNKTLSSPDRAAAMVRAAIRIALSPAPGPVHLEIPADMFDLETGDDAFCEEEHLTVNSTRQPPDMAALERILSGMAQARKPIILAGKGVVISQAWKELTRLAEVMSIPVVTSLGGKGAIDEAHPLSVGVIGRNSRKIGNDAVRECDAVLAIGTRLGGLATHRWTLPFAEKRLYHIDADALIIGQNFRTHARVVADAKLALEGAISLAAQRNYASADKEWSSTMTRRVSEWRDHASRLHLDQKVDGIHPAEVIAALRRNMKREDIIGADTGAHGGWVGALFEVAAGKTMIRANGSLGWIFPGALGASLANPAGRVVAVTGDGGMLYHIGEFETAMRIGVPVVVVVLNNACLASEYHTQKSHQRVVSSVLDFRDVDFASVARSFGAWGQRVETASDLDGAIRDALQQKGPALIDVKVSREARSPSANRDKTRLV
jgi:acetolactate synthase-1/2/3 large subunit